MATQEQVCKAIALKKVVTFTYDGGKKRTVELFRQGNNRTTDTMQVRAYQTGGFSNSNTLGWKLFDTDKIKSLSSTNTDINFPRVDYNPKKQDKDILIVCQVR